ncbi:hypothetical protein HPP92_008447 [Vanilla planifolia]|uniref:Uncharacterized protein n=1 Tax=Vanilla planifolia TaxID=51239 RepID=A0A835RDC3_VANPL|nr:hypothetical protein HPP92_008447 [Vanilla planifolia]
MGAKESSNSFIDSGSPRLSRNDIHEYIYKLNLQQPTIFWTSHPQQIFPKLKADLQKYNANIEVIEDGDFEIDYGDQNKNDPYDYQYSPHFTDPREIGGSPKYNNKINDMEG